MGIVDKYGRRFFGAVMVLGLGLALSGCAMGLGEFSKKTAASETVPNPYIKEAVLQDDGSASVKPAALVEEDVPAAPKAAVTPAAMAAATVVPTDQYPNLNVVPPPAKTKLLTAEEKAKVIADLEALAHKQSVAMAKERATAEAACSNLSADDLRKKMAQGGC